MCKTNEAVLMTIEKVIPTTYMNCDYMELTVLHAEDGRTATLCGDHGNAGTVIKGWWREDCGPFGYPGFRLTK